MGKKSPRIKPTKVGHYSNKIKPTLIVRNDKVAFNFRRLCVKKDGDNLKFDYNRCEQKYFLTLIERLKNISGMTKRELIQPYNNRCLRCHPIDFANNNRLSESTFGILGEDVDADAWQFELTANEHGRIHGYFIENVFYIVWLDPKHQLCP